MTFLQRLLWPFSLIYAGIMSLRNMLYNVGWLKSTRFSIPVISVGNLTVGGTGKTPHVEYLLRLFSDREIAVLSRGYKRKTKGFVLADVKATPETLGDEPFQYHRDFPEVTVAVCEKRPLGIEKLRLLQPQLEVVLLDDAMQHRPVSPSFNLMLTDYNRPFYEDYVLPAGLLREPRSGAQRASSIIVTKCPANLSNTAMQQIKARIHRYSNPDAPVFFSTFRYGTPVALGKNTPITKRIVLVTGIANAAPLVAYLEANHFQIVSHLNYADHYHYTLEDVLKLRAVVENEMGREISIITTRKDAVKLGESSFREIIHTLPIFYLPIEVSIIQEEAAFNAMLLQHVTSFNWAAKRGEL